MNEYSALVATFALIPADHDTQSLSPVYNHTSSRPVQSYGPDQPWPLPFSSNPPPGQSELRSFYAHSAAGYTLQETIFEWDSSAPRQMGGAFSMGAEVSTTFLSSTTAIIVAHDYPTYNLAGFEGAMSALKGFKVSRILSKLTQAEHSRKHAQVTDIGREIVVGHLRVMDISKTCSR